MRGGAALRSQHFSRAALFRKVSVTMHWLMSRLCRLRKSGCTSPDDCRSRCGALCPNAPQLAMSVVGRTASGPALESATAAQQILRQDRLGRFHGLRRITKMR